MPISPRNNHGKCSGEVKLKVKGIKPPEIPIIQIKLFNIFLFISLFYMVIELDFLFFELFESFAIFTKCLRPCFFSVALPPIDPSLLNASFVVIFLVILYAICTLIKYTLRSSISFTSRSCTNSIDFNN